jgi:hypothetical protein
LAQKTSWTGAALSQTDINTYLMHEGGAWSTWTPAIVQSGSVTATVTTARYARAGRLIHFQAVLAVTGTGSASNIVTISLPVTANAASVVGGVGYIYDASTGFVHHGPLLLGSTTVVQMFGPSGGAIGYLGNVGFTAALANTDGVGIHGFYEAAS